MAEAFWVSSEKQQWRKRVNLIFMTLYIHVIINLFIKITDSKLISNYQVCGHSSSLMFNSVQPQRNDFFFHFSSSFCFGEEVTYVDLALLQCLRGCEASYKKGFESADYCPLLKAFKARMEARPKLAAYYKSERYAKHPQDTNSMMWRGRQKYDVIIIANFNHCLFLLLWRRTFLWSCLFIWRIFWCLFCFKRLILLT